MHIITSTYKEIAFIMQNRILYKLEQIYIDGRLIESYIVEFCDSFSIKYIWRISDSNHIFYEDTNQLIKATRELINGII